MIPSTLIRSMAPLALGASAVAALFFQGPGQQPSPTPLLDQILGPASARRSQQFLNAAAAGDPCTTTANLAAWATMRALEESTAIEIANCINLDDPDEMEECFEAALEAYEEGVDLIEAQHDERLEVCDDLGGGIYEPDLDEGEFVDGVDHPLMPLSPGSTWTYHTQTPEGLEVTVVTVTDETKVIDEVECIVVHDVVTLNGEFIEDTLDYFAQDREGNVWYFGELAMNFENGELANLDGSWTADVDGAKPGLIMLADPRVGETYRQEFLLTEAEDLATILSLSKQAVVPFGTFNNCLKTEDYTPIEPEIEENKFYAPGVGLVLTVNPDTGEQTKLVSFTK